MLLDFTYEGARPATDELLSWRFIEIVPEPYRAARTVLELKLSTFHLLHEVPRLRVRGEHQQRLIRDLPARVCSDDARVLQTDRVEHGNYKFRRRIGGEPTESNDAPLFLVACSTRP